ncbi:MAG: hypothetical protein QM647_15105 [Asticcacaulis sp.]|uniref:hypothetical protein n=1 Tax=Asticcacaulis sp. TaxID=1872648 RepID=UPI0039E32C6F
MPKPTLQQQLDALFDKLWPEMAQAFREAVAEIRSRITLKVLIDRLTAGDIQGALEALHIDRAAFYPLEQALTLAYQSGGAIVSQAMPLQREATGARVVIRFDMRNPRAEAWLAERSSQLVTGIVDDQRASIQSALVEGMAKGQNPTTTALQVVGRINRATGKREGGIVGLTSQQAQYVAAARQELLSGDPAQMANYLARSDNTRDKRFDKAVRAAMKAGKPLPADTVNAAVTSYENRMLKYRGDLIGKTETFGGIAASKHEAYAQAIQSGKVLANRVKKRWKHFPNEHPRLWHEAMANVEVPFDGLFSLPDGSQMAFAHDPTGGMKNNAGCHCQTDYFIDYFESRA